MVLALPAAAQDYSFRNYAQADGLQGLSVSTLFEDREGVVWAGTELGLHRFERERFEFVGRDAGIDAVYILGIAEDRQGRLWVASSNGVFVGKDGRFVPVLRAGRPVAVDRGNTLVADGDGMVLASHQQLLRIDADAAGRWRYTALPLRLAGEPPLQVGEALLADGDALWAS
ncbi:MAG TPA: hypothetical protein DDZ67_11370, partial [Xanthomonadaceae bacterium]|nr:hypothetical protein [Xanthomonadaceae bacterium]